MGTTLTALAVLTMEDHPPRFVLLNVGDSRTYVMRNGRLRRVSVDHSYVQELVSTGHITEQEARNHPRRNIVTRALGIEPTVRVDTWVLPLVQGDRYVLCSDGLVDEVVSGLFRAFFEDGRDIGDHEVLVDIGNVAGMRPEGVAKMLASDDDKNTVSMEFMQAQQMGIRGVPCFIFGSKVAVNGAETPETIAMAIDAALEELIARD
jgi:hypothetical protein